MQKVKAYFANLWSAILGRGVSTQDTGGGTVPTNPK